MIASGDTIAAIATPPGNGGVGIIRISGPDSAAIARQLSRKKPLTPRHAVYTEFFDADGERHRFRPNALLPGPRLLYRREMFWNCTVTAARVVLDMLLRRVLALGARRPSPANSVNALSLTKNSI